MAPNSRSRIHRTEIADVSVAASSIAERLGGAAVARALIADEGDEAFHLSPLPYGYSALEPVIDRETLHWHHDVHHRSYVDKLNEALRGRPVKGMALEEILSRVSMFANEVRGNGGGHWNHTFFWSVMTDQKEDQEITPEVLSAIERDFFSFDEFRARFVKAGIDHLGSGWVWLIRDSNGKLAITTTANHDNPLMDVVENRGAPILVCDLWEHAYYLKYKARREDFLRKFFTVVNWSRVHALFIGEHRGGYRH